MPYKEGEIVTSVDIFLIRLKQAESDIGLSRVSSQQAHDAVLTSM